MANSAGEILHDAKGASATARKITVADADALDVGPNGTTNPTLQVDTSTASAATGVQVKSAAAAGGVAVSAISSGTNENLTVDAKGSGTITLNGTGTGNIVLGRAATGVSLAVTGALSSSGTAGIGYATGAGGAVTQATNRSTGVTVNKISGTITTNNTSLGAEAAATFTVTNSTVAIGDVVVVAIQSGSNGGNTVAFVSTVAAGSFAITVANNNAAAGTAETGAILINFAVIKAVSA